MNIVIEIVILAVYTLVLIMIGGQIPSSLSASVFYMPLRKRWIWTVVLAAVCFLCVPTQGRAIRASGWTEKKGGK